MGSIYPRGTMLWMAFKDTTGRRRLKPTGYRLGEEEKARAALDLVEKTVRQERQRSGGHAVLTLEAYVLDWVEKRKPRVWSWDTELSRLKHNVLPTLGSRPLRDVTRVDVRDVVVGMMARNQAPRTTRDTFATLRRVYRDALFDGLVTENPCQLPPGVLPKKRDKDPHKRATDVFTVPEVEQLLNAPAIPLVRRVVYAMTALTGMRSGEVCAMRWEDWDPTWKPLGRLTLDKSYNTRHKRLKQTKTELPRYIPVHPALAKLLTQLKAATAPSPSDPIVRVPRRANNANVNWKRMQQDLARIGMRPRTFHSGRATHKTMGQAAGLLDAVRGTWTDGARHDVEGGYMRTLWETKCREMLKLEVRVHDEGETPAGCYSLLQPQQPADISSTSEWRRWELKARNVAVDARGDAKHIGLTRDGEDTRAEMEEVCSGVATALHQVQAALDAAAAHGANSREVSAVLALGLRGKRGIAVGVRG